MEEFNMNNVSLVGRLTKDVDIRYTQNGNATARFTVAVDRKFTNSVGQREADFIPVVAWKKLAENVANYCVKGSLVGVSGNINVGNYEKDGKKVWVTEVIANEIKFLSSPKNNENGQQNNQGKVHSNPFAGRPVDVSADDLPF
jgi:single-strand DNA-binding protein